MSKAGLEVKIEGILTPIGETVAALDPLYLPLEQETDLRPNYVETTSPKVGSDPNVDIYTNMAEYPVLLNLEGGAFNEYFDVNTRKYFEPYHSRPSSGAQTTMVRPLLWTLDPNNPLMVGCEHVTTEGASQIFDQYIRFKNKLYALDKTNNKIWKLPAYGSAWTDITPTSMGTASQLFVDGKATKLFIGTESAKSWYTTNSNPSSGDWTQVTSSPIGSVFVQYGNDVYYVNAVGGNGYAVMRRNVSDVKKQNAQFIGDASKNVNTILWADRFIVLGKPEGAYVFDPRLKQGGQLPLQPFVNRDSENGSVLFLHGREVCFASVDDFYLWNLDSGALLTANIARFTGYGARPFINGRVLAGMSDGRNMYLVYMLLNDDGSGNTITDYYLLIGNGQDWHPVLAVSVWGTGSTHAAVWYDNNRLWYSMGGKSGYLRTDGKVPIATTAFTYSTDAAPIGITTGWIDAGRDWLDKWWKELRISLRDRGTKGTVKVSYQTWGTAPATWTTIGTLQGNQDNTALAFPAGAVGISTVVTSKINLLFELRKADGTENTTAHYLASAHLVGMPFYEPAFQCGVVGYFDTEDMENKINGRNYNAASVEASILYAQAQIKPVKITLPDGKYFYGSILPGGSGMEILDVSRDSGKPRRYKYGFVFREAA